MTHYWRSSLPSLEAVRPEAVFPKTMRDCDFAVVELYGIATQLRDGASYQGVTRGSIAEDWCFQRGLRKSAPFHLDLYTPSAAATLVRAWCHRMQYFFNLHVARGLDVRHMLPQAEV